MVSFPQSLLLLAAAEQNLRLHRSCYTVKDRRCQRRFGIRIPAKLWGRRTRQGHNKEGADLDSGLSLGCCRWEDADGERNPRMAPLRNWGACEMQLAISHGDSRVRLLSGERRISSHGKVGGIRMGSVQLLLSLAGWICSVGYFANQNIVNTRNWGKQFHHTKELPSRLIKKRAWLPREVFTMIQVPRFVLKATPEFQLHLLRERPGKAVRCLLAQG